MYKLRTLDVWDTLLRRDCHPDCSKLNTSTLLWLKYSSNLKKSFLTPKDIYIQRCTIEGDLFRSSPGGEYKLEDVLMSLVETVTIGLEAYEITEAVEYLFNSEVEFEKKHTYPDSEIQKFCDSYPAEKTMFLSDFYMGKDVLKTLLSYHKLTNFVSDGIVSCDVGLNKRSGQLFSYVMKLQQKQFEDFKFSDWVHIGDSAESDLLSPQKLGIHAVQYVPEKEHADRRLKESLFDINTLNSLIIRLCKDESMRSENFKMGVKFAPLFIGYSLFIAEQAIRNKLSKLFFFTREGEFFIEVWKTLFPRNKYLGLTLPKASLIEVSRIATFVASLNTISTSEMMRMWNLYSVQSMGAMFKSLDLVPDEFHEICNRYGIELYLPIKFPWQDKRVLELFKDEDFRCKVTSKIIESRALLDAYLVEKGFDNQLKSVGLVDIGWRGTIQDNLSTVRPNVKLFGLFLGLSRVLNAQPVMCSKVAYVMNGNISRDNQDLLNDASILEMICNSPNGSTTGYKKTNDGIKAIRTISASENEAFYSFTNDFQQGVLKSASMWANYVDAFALSSEMLKDLSLSIWKTIVFDTPEDLFKTKIGLCHNETFGVGAFIDQKTRSEVGTKKTSRANFSDSGLEISYPSLTKCVKALISKKDRFDVISFVKLHQTGVRIRRAPNIGLIRKAFLLLLVKVGLLYKGYVMKR